MAKPNNTEINISGELEHIGNTLWRIRELASIAARCLYDDELEAPTVAVLADVIAEMADDVHTRTTDLEADLNRQSGQGKPVFTPERVARLRENQANIVVEEVEV